MPFSRRPARCFCRWRRWVECGPRRGFSAGRRSRASPPPSSRATSSRSWSGPTRGPKKPRSLFPTSDYPGAEKILLFCGVAAGLPLESNGLRVLTRVGYGRAHLKNYGAMYRSVEEAIGPELPKGAERLARAHLLLRAHGKTICRDGQPQCHECPVEEGCAFRNPGASKGLRNTPGTGG